jgi:hypothetical protein
VTGILSLDYLNAGGAISMAGNVLRNRPGGMPLAAAQAATWLSLAQAAAEQSPSQELAGQVWS